jgi:predicted transcriptional regulator
MKNIKIDDDVHKDLKVFAAKVSGNISQIASAAIAIHVARRSDYVTDKKQKSKQKSKA